MRVLVTGHLGYIGTVLVPVLPGRGPRRRGPRHATCTAAARSATRPRMPSVPAIDADLRDVRARAARRDRGDRPPRGAVQRSAGRPRSRTLTYDINHQARVRLARLGRERGRRALPVLVIVQQLRGGGGAMLDETRRSARSRAYGESKVRVERDIAALRRTRLHGRLAAQRHRVRRLAAPALRRRAQQPRRVGAHHRRGAAQERRDAVAADRPHPGHRRRPSCWRSRRRASVVGGRAFNVGRDRRELPGPRPGRHRRETVPGCEVEIARTPRPTPATTGSAATDSLRRSGSRPSGTRGGARPSSRRRSRETGLTLDEVEGPRFQRIARIRERLADGSLGPDLRVRPEPSLAHAASGLTRRWPTMIPPRTGTHVRA